MTEIHVSHYMPEDHGTHRDFILPWATALEKTSGGRAKVVIHAGGSSFGTLEKQYDQVISGTVDVAHSPASLPKGRFPRTCLLNLPFLARNSAEGTRLLQGLLDPYLRAEFKGLAVLALHADSGGVLHTKAPIGKLEDLAGLTLRCPTGPMAEVLACVGAKAVPLLPPQINDALRAGAIDGAVMAWDVLEYTGTADVLRHHLDTRLYVSPLYFVMNEARYRALPADLRDALDSVSGKALAPHFPRWWARWEKRGRELGFLPGHTVATLADRELDDWRQLAAPAIGAHLDALVRDGIADAHAVYEAALALRE